MNSLANELAKEERGDAQDILAPTYDKHEVFDANSKSESWMDEILYFLQTEELPVDRYEARKLRAKAARYVQQQGNLFRHCYSWPLAKCICEEDSKALLERIHSDDCGTHATGRNLVL
ncbi:hypothetical protein AXF42_Ash014119 [Apostasia shenzhenica]|uniref:Uncharacterized protein n=1 Tax=Apostasia shenzhenica TaxID=1088818 RepID=A0A2I0A9G6_9ASPA|nr:hypothetical protein AXF42_Ash014119 [Apostasia shenzhenica]